MVLRQVITRPAEGQSPVISGQVHGDRVRQKPGQQVRSSGAQAPRLSLIRALGLRSRGMRVPGEAGQPLSPISVFRALTIVTL